MTAKMYYDSDADPQALAGQRIAILGFGSQGHAHAINLKESGHDVVVGLQPSSKSGRPAADAGLRVETPADAVRQADVVMVLVPDTTQADLYEKEIAPNLKPGAMLMFAHGFNIHFKQISPPENVDVSMVAPKGPGHLVRSTYAAGQGARSRSAGQQTAPGRPRERPLAYARGIGGTRAGVLETTFKEETETDLFGEQAALCGGGPSRVETGLVPLGE